MDAFVIQVIACCWVIIYTYKLHTQEGICQTVYMHPVGIGRPSRTIESTVKYMQRRTTATEKKLLNVVTLKAGFLLSLIFIISSGIKDKFIIHDEDRGIMVKILFFSSFFLMRHFLRVE